jgi:hypothetical protein
LGRRMVLSRGVIGSPAVLVRFRSVYPGANALNRSASAESGLTKVFLEDYAHG